MREFNYGVDKLLKCVKDRPCLWDKTIDNYKDRVERRAAWEDIFNILDERYSDKTPQEKHETGVHIMNKWQNIRDTFIRTLKVGKNGKPKRKYMFHDQLKFLTKLLPETSTPKSSNEDHQEGEPKRYRKRQRDEQEEEIQTDKDEDSVNEYYMEDNTEISNDYADSSDNEEFLRPKIKIKQENSNNVKENEAITNDINFIEVDETNPRLMNEDEAFFASLLPTVVRYNEDERLEFRIQVLNVMNKIREKQRNGEYASKT